MFQILQFSVHNSIYHTNITQCPVFTATSRKPEATVLYNCVLHDDGPGRLETGSSLCSVIQTCVA
jgi:hypothetical protein